MSSEALMQVRATLTSVLNTTGGDARSGIGGVEVQKRIDEIPVRAFNDQTDVARMLRRESGDQLSKIWNLKKETAAGSGVTNSSFAFFSDGGTGTPQVTTSIQLFAPAKSYRTDYEVAGMMIVAGMGNQLLEQASEAANALAIGEEKCIICGSDTSAYGVSSAFPGLLQLMNSYVTLGDTTSTYGIARASGKTYLDVGLVGAGASSADALALADLRSAKTVSDKRGGARTNRIWLCSLERRDEIDALLQAQQRFTGDSIEIEGGFRVATFLEIPIVGSRFMDKNGITYNGSTQSTAHTDQSMYLLVLDDLQMYHVAGVNAVHVPLLGKDASIRSDVRGGYYKTYGTFVMKRFDRHVLIYNLTDI